MSVRLSHAIRVAVGALLCGVLFVSILPGVALGTMQPAATTALTGRVTDVLTGLPISGARVSIGDGNFNYRATTDANGKYTISSGYDPFYGEWATVPMVTGSRVVYMRKDGYEQIAKQVMLASGKTTVADAQLGPAQDRGNLYVTVEASGGGQIDRWISVYREGASGKEFVRGVWIEGIEDYSNDLLLDLTPGTYYLWATSPGRESKFYGGSTTLAAATPIVVTANSAPGAYISLGTLAKPAYDVTVKSAASDAVLSGIRVAFTQVGPLGESIWPGSFVSTTGASGRVTGTLSAAQYLVRFSDAAGTYAGEYYEDALVTADADVLDATLGPLTLTGALEVAAAIAGTNRDNADTPLAPVEGGETIRLYSLSSATGEWTQSAAAAWNADGTYDLDPVHPGTYRLGSERWNAVSREFEELFYAASGSVATVEAAEDVVVAAGDTRTDIDFGFSDPIPVPVDRMLRVSGDSRYSTAIEISKTHFTSADTVVLATGSNFPDALSASALAGAYEGPLLLTETGRLTAGVASEIARLKAKKVVIVGSTVAVSAAVASSVDALPGVSVERVSGINRYDTSAMIARRVAMVLGVDTVPEMFLVRGDNFADALSASSLAYRNKIPVLLTEPNKLRPEADCVLRYLGVENVVIAGSTKAVGSAVVQNLSDNMPLLTVERVYGADRYATSAALATWGATNGYCGTRFMGFATGLNYPDALGGGAAAGARNGVLLLTDPRSLSAPAKSFVTKYGTVYTETQVFGSGSAVTDGVKNAIVGALP